MYLMTPEDFEPWIGKAVRVNTTPQPVEVTLARIKRFPFSEFREPFSLYFESAPQVYLMDATYAFDCGRGGPYSLYITQLQPMPGKPRVYEAVFN